MTPTEVQNIIGNIPYMSIYQAQRITKFIQEQKINSILELGFYKGASTCYMAAALAKVDDASIVTIDLLSAKKHDPGINQLLGKLGYQDIVTVYYEPTSYLWRLMKFIEEDHPKFDLCYLDGSHDWYTSGYAFFLVDKLLQPGGWIILDDLDWTMEKSKSQANINKPEEERITPQVRKVWELLVKQHPNYGNFKESFRWGYAQKIK